MHHELLQVQPAATQREHRDCNWLQNFLTTPNAHCFATSAVGLKTEQQGQFHGGQNCDL
ncbi:hypothetical protein [Leisingera sp. ANG1]|uniref:hypothetical protein n=1 Tax=Leisingera sp. ANG1 TaxID=1002340 RepID=UPI0012E0BF0C|nr:hypothetical protein [Leisingera sp. ANG1]